MQSTRLYPIYIYEPNSYETSKDNLTINMDEHTKINNLNNIEQMFDDSDSDGDESSDIIQDEHLCKYEYVTDIATGIKLYSGVIIEKKESTIANIEFYSSVYNANLLDKLNSSTLTAKGMINNIDFKDETVIKKMSLPTDQRIVKIGCNEEEIYIYPNEHVNYNIAHVMDIVKNSLNSKYKTRIGCNCQNLLDHRDYLIKEYNQIKNLIIAVKKSEIVKKIEKYLLTRKQRNKQLLDKLMKIYKKLLSFVFHPYLYHDINIKAMHELFNQLATNALFERDEYIQMSKDLFGRIEKFVMFFKDYISKCKCITQPYEWEKKIQVKTISSDLKLLNKIKKATQYKYSRRKSQGCGKYFSSQITFEIYSDETKKIYKIKIFRNGNFQTPGIRNPKMIDIINPLTTLTKYLSNQFKKDIYVSYIISVMRNYISNVLCDLEPQRYNMAAAILSSSKHVDSTKIFKTHIYLDKLEEVCRLEKKLELVSAEYLHTIYNQFKFILSEQIALNILRYLPCTAIKFSEIINNAERYPGILLKFNRSIPEKPNKKITIKILCGGKFNFDGCNSELEVLELYHWLQHMFKKYWDHIMFDPTKVADFNYVSDDSDDGYLSLYDDDDEIIKRKRCVEQSQQSHDPNSISSIIESIRNR